MRALDDNSLHDYVLNTTKYVMLEKRPPARIHSNRLLCPYYLVEPFNCYINFLRSY